MFDDEDTPKRAPVVFTAEEDDRLRELILNQKLKNWVKIAALMDGRNVHQCRERWRLIYNNKGSENNWTNEEDQAILSKYYTVGNKWKDIQTFVPKHTVQQVKARISYLLRQENVEYFPPKSAVKVKKTKRNTTPRKRRAKPKKEKGKEKEVVLENESIEPIITIEPNDENILSSLNPIEVIEKESTDADPAEPLFNETNFLNPDSLDLEIFPNSNPFENPDLPM